MARRVFCAFAVCVLLILPASAYDDNPPSNAPFTGCCYISCYSSQFGYIDVYLPLTYQSDYLSFDGRLFNVTNSTVSGVFFADGIEYSFRVPSWGNPQYRVEDDYYWADLTISEIVSSNVVIADSFPPLVSSEFVISYVPIALLGVIVLCLFMKRF